MIELEARPDGIEAAETALLDLVERIRAGRDSRSVDGLLDVLRATIALRDIEMALALPVVCILRELDTSWVEIGSALGLTRQAAWERYHAVEGTMPGVSEGVVQDVENAGTTPPPSLEPGRVYTRVELQRLFAIRDATLKNGVFQMKERSEIWLFVTECKQSDRVQYEDCLTGDTLQWQGQTTGRTDQRIIDHAAEGNHLLVFYRRSKTEFPGAGFRLEGRFNYLRHAGPPPTRFILERAA